MPPHFGCLVKPLHRDLPLCRFGLRIVTWDESDLINSPVTQVKDLYPTYCLDLLVLGYQVHSQYTFMGPGASHKPSRFKTTAESPMNVKLCCFSSVDKQKAMRIESTLQTNQHQVSCLEWVLRLIHDAK